MPEPFKICYNHAGRFRTERVPRQNGGGRLWHCASNKRSAASEASTTKLLPRTASVRDATSSYRAPLGPLSGRRSHVLSSGGFEKTSLSANVRETLETLVLVRGRRSYLMKPSVLTGLSLLARLPRIILRALGGKLVSFDSPPVASDTEMARSLSSGALRSSELLGRPLRSLRSGPSASKVRCRATAPHNKRQLKPPRGTAYSPHSGSVQPQAEDRR